MGRIVKAVRKSAMKEDRLTSRVSIVYQFETRY